MKSLIVKFGGLNNGSMKKRECKIIPAVGILSRKTFPSIKDMENRIARGEKIIIVTLDDDPMDLPFVKELSVDDIKREIKDIDPNSPNTLII